MLADRLSKAPKIVHLVLRADGHWYALIVCEIAFQHEHLPSTCEHPDIGIDVGLKVFLTDSEGHTVAKPRYYRKSQKTLRQKQRMLCRRKKGSKRRRKAAKNVAKTHLKISRQRRDFHFKVTKQYAESYHCIAVEDLAICNMVQNHSLAKSINDAGLSQFLAILEVKAASAGHQVVRVNPPFHHTGMQQVWHTYSEILKCSHSYLHLLWLCGGLRRQRCKKHLFKAGTPPSDVKHPDGDVRLRSSSL
jgi:putative transposase